MVRGGHFVDENYLRMFRREAETLARLVHPNIAAIYEPILAHPPSTMYQLRKLVARHRFSFAAAGAIAVLLAALAVTLVVQGQRVRKERDRAESEAAKASAINGFLKDALGAADPWSASKGSRTVTLLDALRQAQAKAHAAFLHQPLIEAAVLQTIGVTFANLAEYAEGEKALRRALDLRAAAAGRRSPEAAESWTALARMYLTQAEVDKGEKAAREALDITKSLHAADPRSLEVAEAMNVLGDSVRVKGKFPEAQKMGEDALSIARAHRSEPARGDSQTLDPRRVEINALRVLGGAALDQDDPSGSRSCLASASPSRAPSIRTATWRSRKRSTTTARP